MKLVAIVGWVFEDTSTFFLLKTKVVWFGFKKKKT